MNELANSLAFSTLRNFLINAYRISSNKSPAALNGLRHELEGCTYFKIREINNIKCQNRVIFAFKIKNETINFHYQ